MNRILIIDDDQMMLNALTTLLETEGFESVTALTGERGIEIFRNQRPNAVLLDLRLPVKNGIEVLKEMKRMDPTAKVIIITGYPTPEVKEEAMNNGAFYFYEKTRDISELIGALHRAFIPKSA